MGFLHIKKVMSIEEVYSQYKTASEQKGSKKIKIFEGFKFEKGMTLQEFEDQNREVYKRYEGINTELNSQEYQQASLPEKIEKFAKIYKKYYPEDAADLDKKIKELAKHAEDEGRYTFANFLQDVNKQKPSFGVDDRPKQTHVVGQEDTNGIQPKEGDNAVKDDKTFKFSNGEWKEIKVNNAPKAPEIYNPDNMQEGREGDFAVRDGNTYRFFNGEWVKIKTQ